MKRNFSVFVLALLIAAIPAFAGSNLTLVGVNGFSQDGYYDNPLFGTLTGSGLTFTNANIYCDDLLHEVSFGQTWQVNVINGASASGARFFGSIGQVGYVELFWLVTQYTAANLAQWGNISEAGWDITTPGRFTNPSVLSWLSLAGAHYSTIKPGMFDILTPTGYNGGQEMIYQDAPVPEPPVLAILGGGLFSLGVLVRRKR
jgi:hypothetical protein